MVYKYKIAVCAGTFDRLHDGHKAFLNFAYTQAENVYVALTSDKYTAVHKPDVATFDKRKESIEQFLAKIGVISRTKIISIDDKYGIAIDSTIPLDAIIVSEETYHAAEEINQVRVLNGLKPLVIVVFPLVVGETGLRISSSTIRSGAFDTNGVLLAKENILQTTLTMPEALRKTLKKPFGDIISPESLQEISQEKIIAVGDVTTKVLHELGITNSLFVVDFTVERKQQQKSLMKLGLDGKESVFKVINPPSTLRPNLWKALKEALISKKPAVVIVDGEEDLAVIPLLLLAPFGYVICYGQPHQGLVRVVVTEENKSHALDLLLQFSKDTRGH